MPIVGDRGGDARVQGDGVIGISGGEDIAELADVARDPEISPASSQCATRVGQHPHRADVDERGGLRVEDDEVDVRTAVDYLVADVVGVGEEQAGLYAQYPHAGDRRQVRVAVDVDPSALRPGEGGDVRFRHPVEQE